MSIEIQAPQDPAVRAATIGLLGRMLEVMKKVSYIQRDATNKHDNYSYASEKAIKEALHEALTEVGIIFQLNTSNPRVMKSEVVDGQGNVTWRNVTWIDVTYRFIDAETGAYMEGTFLGSGAARDEKGHYAAVTGALKYILTSSFLIPTGDDAEADEDPTNENVVKAIPKDVVKPTPKALKTKRDTAPTPEYQKAADQPPPAPPRGRGRLSSPPAQTRRSEPDRVATAPRPPSDAQNKFLAVLVNKKLEFADDRDAVHEWMTGVLGKSVTSQKHLTSFDAHKLIEKLQAMSDAQTAPEEEEDDLPF